MSIPQIPPRPTRSHLQQQNVTADLSVPQVPPRPSRRSSQPSESPNQENFPRSPFNEPPGPPPIQLKSSQSGGLYTHGQNESNPSLPQRPPSVSLPSVGQEGNEYADIDYKEEDSAIDDAGSHNELPKETRNVAGDLPLHAPKPSFSDSTAKKRVSTVTRTDSSQAAAVGLGKSVTPATAHDDADPHDRNLKSKVSFRAASAASTERPGSSYERPDSAQLEDEHGIPEIGQRVPMYPDAGDVQAPSPSPFQQQFPAGIGFHNSGIAKGGSRQHRRTPSGRDVLPPGSYGMHGHGVQPADKFEQDWYAKHPDALQKEEHGEYGPGIGGGRGEWALSSDDLNKLVRETSSKATPILVSIYCTGPADSADSYEQGQCHLGPAFLTSRLATKRLRSTTLAMPRLQCLPLGRSECRIQTPRNRMWNPLCANQAFPWTLMPVKFSKRRGAMNLLMVDRITPSKARQKTRVLM